MQTHKHWGLALEYKIVKNKRGIFLMFCLTIWTFEPNESLENWKAFIFVFWSANKTSDFYWEIWHGDGTQELFVEIIITISGYGLNSSFTPFWLCKVK